MNLEFLERKDFWSGVMLIAIGGGALFIARNYQFGSSLRMGPGYFPIILSAALVLFGVFFAARGLRCAGSGYEQVDVDVGAPAGDEIQLPGKKRHQFRIG